MAPPSRTYFVRSLSQVDILVKRAYFRDPIPTSGRPDRHPDWRQPTTSKNHKQFLFSFRFSCFVSLYVVCIVMLFLIIPRIANLSARFPECRETPHAMSYSGIHSKDHDAIQIATYIDETLCLVLSLALVAWVSVYTSIKQIGS